MEYDMQAELKHIIESINKAVVDPVPSDNIYLTNVFSDKMYQTVLKNLPPNEAYDYIIHPDAVLPDGTKTRMLLDITASTLSRIPEASRHFWQQISQTFSSQALQDAITQKFAAKINERFGNKWPEMITVPILYRDFTGYYISVHPDAPYKIATLQLYFPIDNSQVDLGTSFYLKMGNQFTKIKTNQFLPNTGYAFVRTDNSWHGVEQINRPNIIRNTLAITVYEKGSEYKSSDRKM